MKRIFLFIVWASFCLSALAQIKIEDTQPKPVEREIPEAWFCCRDSIDRAHFIGERLVFLNNPDLIFSLNERIYELKEPVNVTLCSYNEEKEVEVALSITKVSSHLWGFQSMDFKPVSFGYGGYVYKNVSGLVSVKENENYGVYGNLNFHYAAQPDLTGKSFILKDLFYITENNFERVVGRLLRQSDKKLYCRSAKGTVIYDYEIVNLHENGFPVMATVKSRKERVKPAMLSTSYFREDGVAVDKFQINSPIKDAYWILWLEDDKGEDFYVLDQFNREEWRTAGKELAIEEKKLNEIREKCIGQYFIRDGDERIPCFCEDVVLQDGVLKVKLQDINTDNTSYYPLKDCHYKSVYVNPYPGYFGDSRPFDSQVWRDIPKIERAADGVISFNKK